MKYFILYGLFILAAVVGDSFNYMIGYAVGSHFLEKKSFCFIKKEHLQRTQQFYEKYGGKTILLARFIPIIRTFAPFVAGIGRMKYREFMLFSFWGGLLWVSFFLWGGYFFGNLAFVREHFSLFIIGIIAVSLIPLVVEVVRHRRHTRKIRLI